MHNIEDFDVPTDVEQRIEALEAEMNKLERCQDQLMARVLELLDEHEDS